MSRLLLALMLLLLLSACGGPPQVRLIYLVPAGKQEMPQMEQGARNALLHVQRWYQQQMGNGMTFRVSDEPMMVVHSSQNEDWFRKNIDGDDPDQYIYYNAVAEVRWRTIFSSDKHVILLDADVEGQNGEAWGSTGYALMPWRYARAYAGQNIEPTCRAVGVLAHELGHVFGLHHPKGCVSSEGYHSGLQACDQIMYWGSERYPSTTLSETDKSALLAHSMFLRMTLPPTSTDLDCERLLH